MGVEREDGEPGARRWLGIRHAESVWNARALWQGQADPRLSPAGRRQAEALAERLAPLGLVRLVASDLRRARETAQIVAARLALPWEAEPALRERDVGAWSGLTHAQVAARWPRDYARWRAGDPELRPGGGESLRQLAARAGAALARLRARHGGDGGEQGPLGLVTHMGVLRVLVPGARLENAGLLWLDAGPGAADAPGASTEPPRPGRAESADPTEAEIR